MKREIFLAGGCFWGLEKYLGMINGVIDTEVGYANGKTEAPTYQEVCYGYTDHAETVRTIYDDELARLPFLLSMFYRVIDPTSLNRQGQDVGRQYRSGIYFVDDADRDVIFDSVLRLQGEYAQPVVIEVKRLRNYYPAEDYHQKYLKKNPGGYCHIGHVAFDVAKSANLDEAMG